VVVGDRSHTVDGMVGDVGDEEERAGRADAGERAEARQRDGVERIALCRERLNAAAGTLQRRCERGLWEERELSAHWKTRTRSPR
jgi:hypothetical protein